MVGLNDKQQALLSLASMIFISVGALVSVRDPNPAFGMALSIIGAIGIGIKEWLGAQPTPQQ